MCNDPACEARRGRQGEVRYFNSLEVTSSGSRAPLVGVELEGAIERLVERTKARSPEVRRDGDGSAVRYRVSWA